MGNGLLFLVTPLKLVHATGSPIRAIGMSNEVHVMDRHVFLRYVQLQLGIDNADIDYCIEIHFYSKYFLILAMSLAEHTIF